ncbi:MAG: 1-acyl-sn-glycerol-3-phosphate acyltransferase [Maribacter sp.]
MKGLVYAITKLIVKGGLHAVYKEIKITGMEHIPKDRPILFLPNHQSALIDVLLIATNTQQKSYFLTRADVFTNAFLNRIFMYFRMLPIYRIRDGRKALSRNDRMFDTYAELLARGEALTLFPEANHNLQRRVRPLSKGFTRIIIRTFERYPDMDILLVPVGLNYGNALHFPDRVALHFGQPISAKSLYTQNDLNLSSIAMKNAVTTELKTLTTHIPKDIDYEITIQKLKGTNIDFLSPNAVYETLNSKNFANGARQMTKSNVKKSRSIPYLIFTLLNLPVVLIWKGVLKPKVPEAEFMGTFRFASAMVLFPIYVLVLFMAVLVLGSLEMAFLSIVVLCLVNLILVKHVL